MSGELRGRRGNLVAMTFGKAVWYKRLKENAKKILDANYEEGIWLGHAQGNSETIIGTPLGVAGAWAMKRKPNGEEWSAEQVASMQVAPAQPDPNTIGIYIPIRVQASAMGEFRPEDAMRERQKDAPRRT